MISTRLVRFLPAFVLLPVLSGHAGGWAVVTVTTLPEQAVAGQPVDVAWVVRQHGMKRVPGLNGRIVARSGAQEVAADAAPTYPAGSYRARLTLPRSGAWTITIHSGFMDTKATLLPLRAVDAGSRALPAVADAERGRHLFVAKGCVTCHGHAASGAPREMRSLAVGPDLTDRRLPVDYLARFLADPSIKTTWVSDNRMPDLELAPREIAALVAFINAERRVSTR
jgi:mono/diheme cytochrome c family protein